MVRFWGCPKAAQGKLINKDNEKGDFGEGKEINEKLTYYLFLFLGGSALGSYLFSLNKTPF